MDEERKRPWARYVPQRIDERIMFLADVQDGCRGEFGPVTVTVDADGITVHWTGDPGGSWGGSWTNLRDLLNSRAALERDISDFEQERAVFRQMAREFEAEREEFRGGAKVIPMTDATMPYGAKGG